MAELRPYPFDLLIRRMFREFATQRSIFDLPATKFYRSNGSPDTSVQFCGMKAANPVGPAAGPQTQMAQNLVLSWLAGSRILELKTIQILDQLKISRPCIDMTNIGFNVEWSQELRLEQSLREYVAGHMLIEMLIAANVLEQNDPLEKTETIFDVSVGYDLKGIQSQQVRAWLAGMKDATVHVEDLRGQIPREFERFRDLPFKTQLAQSATLSTFHGCPADEIESIVHFLLTEMDYHVIIKMNPPMLGKERLEYLLFDRLGYRDLEVNPKAYQVNITLADAVEIVRRLKSTADRLGKTVGVKFSNTLEVINRGKIFSDEVMYLSGPPLHVLALALAEEWRKAFGTEIPISFSAGIDQHNFPDAVAAGLTPITTCTDLLKPGGYGRLHKYLFNLENRMCELGAASVDDYIVKWNTRPDDASRNGWHDPGMMSSASHDAIVNTAVITNTSEVLARALENPRYSREKNRFGPRKLNSRLVLFDCISCDKCIPVCPNDANFYYELPATSFAYHNYRLGANGVEEIAGGKVEIKDSHQIATFVDFCNECGNCDVFCPEHGGPFIQKPRFFSSFSSWQNDAGHNGFFVEQTEGVQVLWGRIEGMRYELRVEARAGVARFNDGVMAVELEWPSLSFREGKTLASEASGHVLNMGICVQMLALLQGILNESRVHCVNAPFFLSSDCSEGQRQESFNTETQSTQRITE